MVRAPKKPEIFGLLAPILIGLVSHIRALRRFMDDCCYSSLLCFRKIDAIAVVDIYDGVDHVSLLVEMMTLGVAKGAQLWHRPRNQQLSLLAGTSSTKSD